MIAINEKLRAAFAHYSGGRYRAAAALYREVLDVLPEHPLANHHLGVLALRWRQPRSALVYFEKAAGAEPRRPQHWASLARCWYFLGEWEKAAAVLQQAASLGLDHPSLSRIQSTMAGTAATGSGRKVFCVGRNKTGTTSLEAALRSLGFRMGLQARGEMLMRDWARRDFTRILALCRTADAFQDVPFSCDHTFRVLDEQFPGSKFILTIRDSPEQWYESLVRFHTRIVRKGRLPTADDLKAFHYRYPGYLWDSAQFVYGVDEAALYDREIYISHYRSHNQRVVEYFRNRPDQLLVLNVAERDAMEKLCAFLGVDRQAQAMPYLNRSA